MYRVLVVEDEPDEAAHLIELIRRYGTARTEVFHTTWLRSSMEMLSERGHYDIVLLDINLPGITGMEAAELLRVYDQQTPIIFVTNLARYAVRGYEVNACGFIVKPVTYGNLSMSLDRALRMLERTGGRTLIVSTENGRHVLDLNQIVYIEVAGHMLSIHLEGADTLEVRGSLSQVEEDLEGAPIVRVSKSCIANMDKIMVIRNADLQMVGGDVLHISRTRKREVTDIVTDYLGGSR